jgi:hypothetical protein
MKIFKNIIVILLMLVFTVSSSGFIIEKYFCSSCNSEHNELVILDIINTHHHDCNVCLAEKGECTCNSKQDIDSKEYQYFNLDVLFVSINKIDINPILINLFSQIFITDIYTVDFYNLFIAEYQSLPPPVSLLFSSFSLNILYSVFIL